MAAIVGTAVTNINLALNTAAEVTYTAATNTGTAGTDTETFYITPTKAGRGVSISVKNACGADITFSLLVGTQWASTVDLPAVTVATGKVFAITIDSAKFKNNSGVIKVKVTPTAGTALTAVGGVGVNCVQA